MKQHLFLSRPSTHRSLFFSCTSLSPRIYSPVSLTHGYADAGHIWKCVENKDKTKGWTWSRISVGKHFTHVACSRNHFAAIGRKEVQLYLRPT
jgi:hypothetical protein